MNFVHPKDLHVALRWRFDFAGKPAKCGLWSHSGLTAWNVDKAGLVRASIEAHDRRTGQLYVAAQCDGHDYVNFEWVGGTVAAMNPGGIVHLQSQIVGLRMHTRDKLFTVMMDGTAKQRFRTDFEKAKQYACFGR